MAGKKVVGELLHRTARITRARGGAKDGAAQYEVAVSSEAEVERWFGIEVLDHGPGAVDMARMRNGAAVLVEHGGEPVGVVEDARVDPDRVLRATVRFSRSAKGREVEQDVQDGIRQHVSVGYHVHEARRVEQRGGTDVWRVTRWEPVEVSIVAVPADASVGVGRSADDGRRPVVEVSSMRGHSMEQQDKAALERDRAATITELAESYGYASKATDWVREGLTVEDVTKRLLTLRAEQSRSQSVGHAALQGMTRREQSEYSLASAILEAAQLKQRGLASEVSDALARDMPRDYVRKGGILVPYDLRTPEQRRADWERRTLSTSVATKGIESVFPEAGEFIELLRNKTAVSELGARPLTGLQAPVEFAKQTGAMTAYWVGENPAADVTSSDVALGLVLLSPKTLQATTAYSRQLLVQASMDVEAMVRADLAAVHARAIDRAAIHGLGAAGV